jgi:hypothetical protein
MIDGDRLQWDYEQTIESIRALTEIRFKLLAFVPTISGAGVALLTREGVSDSAKAGVGILGFLVSLGISFYDARNSELYNALVRRAKALEQDLKLRHVDDRITTGGQFTERPAETLFFFRLIPIRHGEALALIYSAVLAGWGFVALDGFLTTRWAAVSAAAVGILLLLESECLRGDGPLPRQWWTHRDERKMSRALSRHIEASRRLEGALRRYKEARQHESH